ncbi:MAG TPA: heme-binding domain-containing protein, partial [Edaphobacter sp.]
MKVTESGSRTRLLASILMVCVVLFAAIQLIHPKLDNPPVTAELKAPPEVKRILKTSCYNCHSNETHLFWFDKVAPAYWIASSDVREARKHLNFSEIDNLPAAQQSALLYEAINQIQLGGMPLKSYTLLHPEANVSPEDLATLRNFVHPTEIAIPN